PEGWGIRRRRQPRGVPSPRRRPGPGFRRAVRGSSHGTGGRSVPAVRQAARRGTGDRDRQHLQAGHQVLGAARRHVSRRERSAEADHHGQLRHRPRPHRRRGRRAAGRYRWYCLAGRHRPVPRAYRRGQREGPDAGEGRRVALRPVPGAGARTVARRPRRAARREVQGRGPARYADPRDDRQRLREGRYRGGPGAALAGRAEGDSAVGDCERVSREVGDLIDVEGLIEDAYDLEVSSPGLDRLLRSDREFRWAVGKLVRLWQAGGLETRGRLADVTAERLVVERDGERVELPRGSVTKARLDAEVPWPRRG